MLNPQLNLKGTESVMTSVTYIDETKEGKEVTRAVDFLIDANVGGSLNNIDLKFDLSCENNMTIQNELQSKTDNERSRDAIQLLLYNTYTSTSISDKSDLNLGLTASSALFSFLQSKLNAWAAETLPGIDLSFGINQYEGSHNIETSYSYRLAKTLFNGRFKIVVGGMYSALALEEENLTLADNLFSDISLEYYLNDVGSRYLRLFRQLSYENVLEGPVTETGIAYVLKRKLTNLKNFFTFKHSREYLLRDSLEKARKAALKLQENAIDAMSSQDDENTIDVPLDEQGIDKPTVTRKKDDESED